MLRWIHAAVIALHAVRMHLTFESFVFTSCHGSSSSSSSNNSWQSGQRPGPGIIINIWPVPRALSVIIKSHYLHRRALLCVSMCVCACVSHANQLQFSIVHCSSLVTCPSNAATVTFNHYRRPLSRRRKPITHVSHKKLS